MSDSVGRGFNLVMQLEDPSRLTELMAKLASPGTRGRLQQALASLDYVHYARFLPLWEHGLLLIVTEFDGAMKDYVTDFAAALDDEFSLILSYMKDRPPLPVSRYPDQFWNYVDKYTGHKGDHPLAYPQPFSAYPGLTVLEIVGTARGKRLPERPPLPSPTPKVDLGDVQANVVRGYGARTAWHIGFEFRDTSSAQELLKALSGAVTAQVGARTSPTCTMVGLTHAGLQSLGLPQAVLDAFPTAFREGPRLRSERLGDTGVNHPANWRIAGFDSSGHPIRVHGMVTVYGKSASADFDARCKSIRTLMAKFSTETFAQAAEALGGPGEVHFGYRDGIAQPRFDGVSDDVTPVPEVQRAPVGDLLLGKDYRNSRGGYYIGALPEPLATNGTYAAFRVIEQHVRLFDRLLERVRREHGLERDTVAAKLMGRWPNGSPLALNPFEPDRQAESKSPRELDDFDYVAPPAAHDDREGRRCPIGAHARRMNPRSGLVLGIPWGRHIVRRGMPYGARFDPENDDSGEERGLVGLFLCADLEAQFEFIQHVWANQDLSAPGLRNSQDPFIGAREHDTPFRFRPRDNEAEITIQVPPLTTVRGSAYLFMPGLHGLKWLAGGGWLTSPSLSPSK